MSSLPPPEGSDVFLSDGIAWDALRDSGIPATLVSDLDESWEKRSEFLVGAKMMGLTSRRKTLKPQQLLLADALNAGRRTTAVLMPRRSTKTTTLLAWALGKCAENEDFLVGYTTLTTRTKAADRFKKDIVPALERSFPDPKNRPMDILRGAGQEMLRFHNGSFFQPLAPKGESFRSDAFDVIILDEAGEASPEMGEDVLEGTLPTFDTRPEAQLIVAGTAAKYRTGNLLWDTLEDGRNGNVGILDFSAPDGTTVDDLADWSIVEQLVRDAHPGIDTMTTIDIIEERWRKLKPFQFAAEYLGIFGTIGAKPGILDRDRWDACRQPGKKPEPPAKFALAIAAHPDQISASIVAVWREDGRAKVLLLAHRRGTGWLAEEAPRLALKYSVPIIHDDKGTVMVEVEAMARQRPKPRFASQNWGNVSTAAGLIVKEINGGNVDHWGQEKLDEAVSLAQKRGGLGRAGWALGRGSDTEVDITPIEAASLALRVYDATPERQAMLRLTA